MVLFWVLLFIFVVAGILFARNGRENRRRRQETVNSGTPEVLRRLYAQREVIREEFGQKKKDLE